MSPLSHPEIIGIDVCRDRLGIHCLRNADVGDAEPERVASDRDALVCFEAAGGHELSLWASLKAAGIEARQLPPAQVKASGKSRGTLAKTDWIDAELIARLMAFRLEADR